MNMKKLRASKFGRLVARVLGEETGAVMMEYVIIAVLIAAAVAVGAWYFGRSVNNEFRVASHAVVGDDTQANTQQTAAQGKVAGQDEAARTTQKAKLVTDNEDAADL
jgi:Flp pilus assembly pilin Flp